ncbi:ras association domain-containing protein 8 [Macrosteles quadrilineatus]|uniref:ras association domain-containing protein 8 n=1 Tax=Macrosteles quadrilineatus TaxID=74068 RepID=UPI0023E34061|nr:ras association domain-containing protein 8 [Macrosteles quadrilineatus]
MELKVWVEGIQRIVCGVTDTTTCQDVVYALAHATGKTGRFTLIERWRNNERLLAPQEHPLKVLTKWGEYSNDVQFILQRSGNSNQRPSPLSGKNSASPPPSPNDQPPERNKDIRKSLTFSGCGGGGREVKRGDNVGVVRGVPQNLEVKNSSTDQSISSQMIQNSNNMSNETRKEAPPYREPPGPQRALPPYRDPPPPPSTAPASDISKLKPKRSLLKEFDSPGDSVYNTQYRDMIRLVNYQREKLSAQQAELTKYDAEIVFWEAKTREQQHQIEFMAQEITRIEAHSRLTEDQIRALGPVEEENDIVHQQEKTLKSEISLLRSKLANCETELLQCKNKIRLLIEEVQLEERASDLQHSLLAEIERLQNEVEAAKQGAEMVCHTADSLRNEVVSLEAAIADKKRQVERLVADMKEANLQSLAVAPPEDYKLLIEGPHKPGSTRKMIGSPRQLENAVPTSKNPHGVWV